jgi:hypothetical protein
MPRTPRRRCCLNHLGLPKTDKRAQRWLHDARGYLNAREQALATHHGLSAGWQCLVFGFVVIAVFSRSPGLLTHAQFYAEDGAIWFADAYNLGWLHSLALPQAGYLNVMSRLGAGLALLFPLDRAPLVMATLGLLVQCLPVPILLSSRCRNWAPLPTRLLLAAIYVAIPNAREIQIVITNTMWHLALAAVLVGFAASPETWRGRLFDSVLLLVAALSGPFCIVLAPLIWIFWWRRRQRWSLTALAITSIGAFIQTVSVLHDTHRVYGPLGAKLGTFLRMLAGNVFASALIGSHSFSNTPIVLIVLVALAGLGICLYCLRFANLEWKLFLAYCIGLYAASMRHPLLFRDPLIAAVKPAWDVLLNDPSCRYWFFPMLAFTWSAVWCALYGRDRLFRLTGACIFLAMSIGIVHDWTYGSYSDDHFAISVQRMRDAKPGEHVTMPLAPEGWQMELVKKSH